MVSPLFTDGNNMYFDDTTPDYDQSEFWRLSALNRDGLDAQVVLDAVNNAKNMAVRGQLSSTHDYFTTLAPGTHYSGGSSNMANQTNKPDPNPGVLLAIGDTSTVGRVMLYFPYQRDYFLLSTYQGGDVWLPWRKFGKPWDRGPIPTGTNIYDMRGPQWVGVWGIEGGTKADSLLGTPPPGMVKWLAGSITVHDSGSVDNKISNLTYRPYSAGGVPVRVLEATIKSYSLTGEDAWTEWADLAENNGGGGGGDPIVLPESDAGAANIMLMQRMVGYLGGSVGTGGLPVASIRWDHYTNDAVANLVPLHRKYMIPVGWAHYSQQLEMSASGEKPGHDIPWAKLQDYATDDGFEPWCHSRTHKDATDTSGYTSEWVLARDEMQALMPRCVIDKMIIPGVGGTNMGGFIHTNSPDDWYGTEAGRIAMGTFAVTSGHMGGYLRPLTGEARSGQRHIGIETATAATAIGYVTEAQDNLMGVCLMLHPNRIGGTGGMTLADYEAVLAHIAAERDAGRLMVLSMSGALVADIKHDYRHDLLKNSEFLDGLNKWSSSGWEMSGTVADEAWTAGSLELSQTIDMSNKSWAGGAVREVVAAIRERSGNGVSVELRRGTVVRSYTIPVGDTSTHYVRLHGVVSTTATSQTIGIKRTAGGYLHVDSLKYVVG